MPASAHQFLAQDALFLLLCSGEEILILFYSGSSTCTLEIKAQQYTGPQLQLFIREHAKCLSGLCWLSQVAQSFHDDGSIAKGIFHFHVAVAMDIAPNFLMAGKRLKKLNRELLSGYSSPSGSSHAKLFHSFTHERKSAGGVRC